MNQIYNFEQHKPPVLNENMLRAELERRRLRWQTAVIAVSGILLLIAAAMLGFLVLEDYPWITALCLAYVLSMSCPPQPEAVFWLLFALEKEVLHYEYSFCCS